MSSKSDPTYIEDREERVSNERHAGIVVRDGKILLMHRIKNGYEYYVFPGGHRRHGDTGEETVKREVYEETGIKVKVERLAFRREDKDVNQHDHYYICAWISGEEPSLMGEEKIRNSPLNFFEPIWFPVEEVPKVNILPIYAKEWVMSSLHIKQESKSLSLAKNYLGKKIKIKIDRKKGEPHPKWGWEYSVNYGFVEGVIAPDGEELDAYLLKVDPPVETYEGVVVAIVHRTENDDDKLVVIPEGEQITDEEIETLVEFQEKWFKHEIVR